MSVDACRCRWWSRDNLQSVRRSRHVPKMENLSGPHVQIRAIGGSLVCRRPTQCPFSTSTSALALSLSHLHLQLLRLSVRPSTVLPCWRGRCDAGHHSGLRCISSWSEYLVHKVTMHSPPPGPHCPGQRGRMVAICVIHSIAWRPERAQRAEPMVRGQGLPCAPAFAPSHVDVGASEGALIRVKFSWMWMPGGGLDEQ